VVSNATILRQFGVASAIALACACGGGGSYGGPTNPSPGGGGSGPSGATITIANGAVSPSSVTITVGQSVTFVSNDSTMREIRSNPHGTHTDCPAINAVGVLQQGQTKLTDAFTSARSCSFHDHASNDSIAALRGTIVIQ
jgi:plastocyanin